jgi:acyl-CoA thioester hydrolase
VAHEHEQVRIRRREHGLEPLHRFAARLCGVKGGAAAGVHDAKPSGQPPVGRDFAQPVGLDEDPSARRVSGHECVYSIRRVEGFPFVHRETVRFSDLDPMGHVNNAVYLTWIENARIEFLRHVGAFDKPDTERMTMILARVEVDFRAPLGFGEAVEIAVRTARFGTKSFDLEYELRAGDVVTAQAKTVLVAYDYENKESKEIPDEWRRRLAA